MKPAVYSRGFTLAEIAIVLVIVGLLLGGLFMPLSAQQDIRYVKETQKTLNDINDALLGFAAANGRLPCPAASAADGNESRVGLTFECTNPYDGFVPGIALGVGPTNASGVVIDAWGNPIHYGLFENDAAINGVAHVFSTPNGIRIATMAAIADYMDGNNPHPLLSVCDSAVGKTGANETAECDNARELTDSAVAVIYSNGRNAGTGGASADEAENPNPNGGSADATFVSRAATAAPEFDDLVIWLSPNTLYNRMIAAGQLP